MKAKSIDTSLKLKQEQLYVAKYVIVVPKLKRLFVWDEIECHQELSYHYSELQKGYFCLAFSPFELAMDSRVALVFIHLASFLSPASADLQFDEFPSSVSVTENAYNGTLVAVVHAVDPENPDAPVRYEIISASPAINPFVIDASDGEITVSGIVDYETNPSFEITVAASQPDSVCKYIITSHKSGE